MTVQVTFAELGSVNCIPCKKNATGNEIHRRKIRRTGSGDLL